MKREIDTRTEYKEKDAHEEKEGRTRTQTDKQKKSAHTHRDAHWSVKRGTHIERTDTGQY